MPIKNVSDIRRLPRLGKIRLGIKETSQRTGSEYPKAVDYFVCPPEVQAVYGEKPRALDIMFPVEDKNIFFPQWYKRYGASTGLLCRGDGETAIQIDPETGEMQEIECCPDECEYYAKKHCRRLANLQFLLYKVPGIGVYQIDTTSFYSITNLNSAIEMISAVARRIRMIPLQLILKPQEVQPDGKKKTVYVLDLIAPFKLQELLSIANKSAPKFLLLDIDENERPEDLYPDAVLNRQEPEPFALDRQAEKEQKKAEKEAKQRELDQIEEENQQAFDQLMQEHGITGKTTEQQTEPDPVDQDLQMAWDILGTPLAKRQAILNKPNLDKQALLRQLQAEINRRNDQPEKSKKQLKKQASPPVQEQVQQSFF